LIFGIVFQDIVDYHSALHNFDHRKAWKLNNALKNPHFYLKEPDILTVNIKKPPEISSGGFLKAKKNLDISL